MPSVIFQEYRDSLRLTKYPFVDTASLTCTDNSLTLPAEVFCDASIYIPGAVAPVYIQKLTNNSSGLSITVTDYSKQYLATGEINPRSDSIVLLNPSGQQVGLIVASTDLTYFTSVPKGEYEFTPKATAFVPRCVVPLEDVGVTSIGAKDGTQLYGDVWLVGRDGVVLRYMEDEGGEEENPNKVIRIDIVGDPLFKRADEEFEPPKFIQTINGSSANDYGDFRIVVGEEDDILRIDNSPEGITIYAAGV